MYSKQRLPLNRKKWEWKHWLKHTQKFLKKCLVTNNQWHRRMDVYAQNIRGEKINKMRILFICKCDFFLSVIRPRKTVWGRDSHIEELRLSHLQEVPRTRMLKCKIQLHKKRTWHFHYASEFSWTNCDLCQHTPTTPKSSHDSCDIIIDERTIGYSYTIVVL